MDRTALAPVGFPKGSGVTQGWDVLVDGVVVSAPSLAQEAPAAPAPSESGSYREGRGRTGRGGAVPGRRRESSWAERNGGGSPGSARETGSGTGDGEVSQDGSEGESCGMGTLRGAPRAAREPRSRSRAAQWDRARARSGGALVTGMRRWPGSRCSLGLAQRSPDQGGFAGAVGDRRHGAARARGCGQPCSWEPRASPSNLVIMTGDTA